MAYSIFLFLSRWQVSGEANKELKQASILHQSRRFRNLFLPPEGFQSLPE
jgi:hypothetical protein